MKGNGELLLQTQVMKYSFKVCLDSHNACHHIAFIFTQQRSLHFCKDSILDTKLVYDKRNLGATIQFRRLSYNMSNKISLPSYHIITSVFLFNFDMILAPTWSVYDETNIVKLKFENFNPNTLLFYKPCFGLLRSRSLVFLHCVSTTFVCLENNSSQLKPTLPHETFLLLRFLTWKLWMSILEDSNNNLNTLNKYIVTCPSFTCLWKLLPLCSTSWTAVLRAVCAEKRKENKCRNEASWKMTKS